MTVEEAIEFFGNNDQFNAFINYKLEVHLKNEENKNIKKIKNLEEKTEFLTSQINNLRNEIEELNAKKYNLLKEIKEIKNSCKKEKDIELTDAICIEHLKNSVKTYEIYLHQKTLL